MRSGVLAGSQSIRMGTPIETSRPIRTGESSQTLANEPEDWR